MSTHLQTGLPSTSHTDVFAASLSFNRSPNPKKIVNIECFIHFLKGNIGSGLLGIPYAMKLVGIAIGPPILFTVASLCLLSSYFLVKCGTHLRKKYNLPPLGYSEVVEYSFKERFGDKRWPRISVDTLLVLSQYGACTVYVIFISQNIKTVVDNHFPRYIVSIKVYIVILLVFLFLITSIWSLKRLAIVSMIGNLFVITGLTSILVYLFSHIPHKSVEGILVQDYAQIPNFISIAVFAFEAIGLVLPLENQMKTPESFPYILAGGIYTTLAIQIVFGLFGYICFTDATLSMITFNLPEGTLSVVAQLAISATIFLTYPLVFYVPISILMPIFRKRFKSLHSYDIEFFMRLFFLLVTFSLAISIPKIEVFIQLVGASGGTILALIYPPICYLIVFDLSLPKKILTVGILIFGVVSCGVGTTYAVISMVDALS